MRVKFTTSNDTLRLSYLLSDEIFKNFKNDQIPTSAFYYYSGIKIEKELNEDGPPIFIYELFLDLDKLILRKREEEEQRKKNFLFKPTLDIDIKRYVMKKLIEYLDEKGFSTSFIRFLNTDGICLLYFDREVNKFLCPTREDRLIF
jgi:hypothetical protein